MIICLDGIDNTGKSTIIDKFKDDKNVLILKANNYLNLDLTILQDFYLEKYNNFKQNNDNDKYLLCHCYIAQLAQSKKNNYKLILIDRGILTYYVYNNYNSDVKYLAKQFYDEVNILYFTADIITKHDETYKTTDLVRFNYRFMLQIDIAKMWKAYKENDKLLTKLKKVAI